MADKHRFELEILRGVHGVELKNRIEVLTLHMKQEGKKYLAVMKSEFLSKHIEGIQKLESSFNDVFRATDIDAICLEELISIKL